MGKISGFITDDCSPGEEETFEKSVKRRFVRVAKRNSFPAFRKSLTVNAVAANAVVALSGATGPGERSLPGFDKSNTWQSDHGGMPEEGAGWREDCHDENRIVLASQIGRSGQEVIHKFSSVQRKIKCRSEKGRTL